jgi:hypothetical protein
MNSKEMSAFDSALRKVLSVSKNDLNRLLQEEKVANANKPKRGRKPKTASSSHVSSGKG